MESWLYRYEVKGIQSWILASERLAELRGGSAIIENLAVLAAERAGGEEHVLYAAAGGATLRFPDQESVGRFAAMWPLVLSRIAPGLQVVQAWAPETKPRTLYEQLGAERNRPLTELPEAGPWTARSARTGLPAVGSHERVYEDAGTRRRRKAEMDGGAIVGPERIFAEKLSERVPSVTFERDIHHKAWRDAPIAVIHADGNGIGRLVMSKTPEEMRAFSDALTAASEKAARRAVERLAHAYRETCDDRERADLLPARPVVIGGDDFTFLVRGDFGIPFLNLWLEAFEEETRVPALGGGLTACGGIAFVRRGFPFSQAHEIAERLCKEAKAQLREKSRSGLSFARITTSLHDEAANSGVYDLAALRELNEVTNQARILPRGKLRTWVGLVDAGDTGQADQLWARTGEIAAARDAAARQREAWRQLDRLSGDSRYRAVADALSWLQVSNGRPTLWGSA